MPRVNHRCPRLKLALLPSPLLSPVCRCFGRRGPSLPPSSSSTRSTLWPVKEEGAYVAALSAPFQWDYRTPLSLPRSSPTSCWKIPIANSPAGRRSSARRCVRPLFSDDKRPLISSFSLPPDLAADSPLNRRGAERRRPIGAGRSVPMASPPRTLGGVFPTGGHKTRPCPSAFQWDGTGNICGLKERGRGGGGRGDAGRGRTSTSLCPSAADGEGQICSILPGEPLRETGYARGQRAACLTDRIVPPQSSDRTSSEPALASCSPALFRRLFWSLISVSRSSSKFSLRLSRSGDRKHTFSRGNWNFAQIFDVFAPLFPAGSAPSGVRFSPGHTACQSWT